MPKAKREIYRRGPYRLDWDRRRDGSLRSPYYTVFWYDKAKRRERSASTGTADDGPARTFLDAFYLGQTSGQAHCPTCGQRIGAKGYLVTEAIASYLASRPDNLPSLSAVKSRLAHVVQYIGTLTNPGVTTDQVDEPWIGKFRAWMERQPVVGMKGKSRARSLSTVEGPVAQLSAAINAAYKRGDTSGPARFKSIPMRGLNRTPQHRSAVDELAAMFRYCTNPTSPVQKTAENRRPQHSKGLTDAQIRHLRIGGRAALHRFLIISVATLARPDAAHDVTTDPKRGQWNSAKRILDLNPKGRRQTKKYRAIVPIARQVAPLLDASQGFYVGPKSVEKAWGTMAAELGLPAEGQAGMKLIRRSMADLLRQRLPEEAWGELSMFMGHDRTDSVTSLYAPFSPSYLRRALAAIEDVLDEIERAVPGALGLPVNVERMKIA